jgi:hypothetical protein
MISQTFKLCKERAKFPGGKMNEKDVKKLFDLISDPLKVEFKGSLNSSQMCIDPPDTDPVNPPPQR